MAEALPAPPPLPALPAPPVALTLRERLAEFKSLEEKRNQLIEVRTETCLDVIPVRLMHRPTGAHRKTRKDRGQARTNRTRPCLGAKRSQDPAVGGPGSKDNIAH
jgi:hypothetical protein